MHARRDFAADELKRGPIALVEDDLIAEEGGAVVAMPITATVSRDSHLAAAADLDDAAPGLRVRTVHRPVKPVTVERDRQ